MAAGILGFLGGGTAHPQIHPSIPILSAPDRRGLGLGAWQPGWGSQPRLEVVDSGLPFPSRSHCKRQVRAEGPGQEGGATDRQGRGRSHLSHPGSTELAHSVEDPLKPSRDT